ncbi:MAG: hypothetical protein JO352_22420 [Chloroflexi bacterium]|nr:hypothetical protein [Chloroflexota bacterium]
MTNLSETQPEIGELIASLAPDQLPSADEVTAARERLDWRRAQALAGRAAVDADISRERRTLLARFSTPWRVASGGAAAALVVVVLVAFTPQGNSAAAAFLGQFRSQQVSAIAITPQSQAEIVRSINALGNLGTVQVPGGSSNAQPEALARQAEAQSRTVTAAEAAQTVGFGLAVPDPATLPPGLGKTPTIKVSPGTQLRFTFDKAKAQAYYQSVGRPEVSLPDKFNGASLSVSIPPVALLSYGGGGASTRNELIVAEAGELVVDVQGNVSLPEMRDFLLGLPGLPPAVVSQLQQIQSWNDTLPIPVPVDQVNWQPTTINGNQGLLLNDNSGVGSAAVWHANGHLYGVAGTLKSADVLNVARGVVVR